MPLRFDLTDLSLFLRVLDAGSITAGAEAAHLSLAAASARILGMEETFGTALLVRLPRGVQATPAGRTLQQHARNVLLQIDRLRGDLAEHAQGLRGRIELLCNTTALHELLPDALGDFLRETPLVSVVLTEHIGEAAVRLIAEHKADLAIINGVVMTGDLQTLPFRSHGFAFITPPDHPMVAESKWRELHAFDFDDGDIVGLSEGTALQDEWERHAAQRGQRLNYRVRVPSFEIQARLVARGAGIALVPEATARRLAQTLPLAVLPVVDTVLQRRLLLCMRNLDELPPITRRLVEFLREASPVKERSS